MGADSSRMLFRYCLKFSCCFHSSVELPRSKQSISRALFKLVMGAMLCISTFCMSTFCISTSWFGFCISGFRLAASSISVSLVFFRRERVASLASCFIRGRLKSLIPKSKICGGRIASSIFSTDKSLASNVTEGMEEGIAELVARHVAELVAGLISDSL